MSDIDPDLLAAIAGILEKGADEPVEPVVEQEPDISSWPEEMADSQFDMLERYEIIVNS